MIRREGDNGTPEKRLMQCLRSNKRCCCEHPGHGSKAEQRPRARVLVLEAQSGCANLYPFLSLTLQFIHLGVEQIHTCIMHQSSWEAIVLVSLVKILVVILNLAKYCKKWRK